MNSNADTLSGNEKAGFKWRFMLTAGVGFFADAYELFIMGVVTAILAHQGVWNLTIWQQAVLNGASLASAALGSITFGFLSDLLGRKKLYGYEIAVLFFGVLLSCTAQNFTWLLIARVIVGLGIGEITRQVLLLPVSTHAHRKEGLWCCWYSQCRLLA